MAGSDVLMGKGLRYSPPTRQAFDRPGSGCGSFSIKRADDGGECLILGAGGDAAFDGEVGEKSFDLGAAHDVRVAEAVGRFVEANVLLDPTGVAAFGFEGKAAQTGNATNFIEQFHGGILPARAYYHRAAPG